MHTFQRIQDFMRSKGKTQKELCDFLGVSQSVFSDWKAGRNESYKKYLPRIADFLSVTANDLIGTEPESQDPQITILSRAAKNMTEEQKSKLIEMAKLLYPDAFNKE